MPIDENARFAGGSKRPRIQTGASRVWPGGHHLVQVWALPSCVTRHTEARSSVIVLRVAAEHGMNCTWSSLPIGGGGGFSSSFPSSTFPAAVASSGMPACFGAAASNDLDALLYACNHFWMCVNLCFVLRTKKKLHPRTQGERGAFRMGDRIKYGSLEAQAGEIVPAIESCNTSHPFAPLVGSDPSLRHDTANGAPTRASSDPLVCRRTGTLPRRNAACYASWADRRRRSAHAQGQMRSRFRVAAPAPLTGGEAAAERALIRC